MVTSHNTVYGWQRVDVLDIPGCTAYWHLSSFEVCPGQVHWRMGTLDERELKRFSFILNLIRFHIFLYLRSNLGPCACWTSTPLGSLTLSRSSKEAGVNTSFMSIHLLLLPFHEWVLSYAAGITENKGVNLLVSYRDHTFGAGGLSSDFH